MKGGANLVDDDAFGDHFLPEPVVTDVEVLGAVGQAMVGGKMVSALIVFEDSSSNSCVKRCRDVESRDAFLKETFDGKKSLEREA